MHLNYAGKQNYSDNITVYFLYDYEVSKEVRIKSLAASYT